MEWCCKSKPRKKFKNNEDDEDNINSRRKSLLSLFIEYAWDEKIGQLSGSEDVELINWLASVNLVVNDDHWDSSSELDIRKEPIINLTVTRITKLNENIVRAARDLNNRIISAQLAYNLRKLIPFLINCKNNIKYTDKNGQTILHAFIKRYLNSSEHLSQTQLTKMQILVKQLIARGASLYKLDKHGISPFYYAAICKDIRVLEVMISCLINVNQCDEKGNTALHIIADNCVDEERAEYKCGYVDVVRNLVSRGADVNAKNAKGATAAHLACEKLNVELLKFLVNNGSDICQRSSQDETLLHSACKSWLRLTDMSKMVDTIDILVSRGCDVEAYDRKGWMPLHYTVEFGNVEVVQRLIELEANVNCQTRDILLTPLHIAARNGRLDVVKKLVELDADVNAEAADGATPIFMTTLAGSLESLQYLIEEGADLYHRDKLRGYTMLHMAAFGLASKNQSQMGVSKTFNDENEERDGRILNFIIEKEFDVNDAGTCGMTPLLLAAIALDADSVKSLVEHGANVNFQSDETELTALHIASMMKTSEIVKILIDAGADVNCRGGPEQWTPIHFLLALRVRWTVGKYDKVTVHFRETSSLRHVKPKYAKDVKFSFTYVMTTLIKSGADVNAKDASGKSPLHFATLRTASHSTKFLLESDVHVNVQDNEGQLPLSNILKNDQEEILQNLLDFGADINDEDVSQQVMNSEEDSKKVALEHVIKLKLLGLPIAKIYEIPIQNLTSTGFYKRCAQEMDMLKNHNVGDLSLYQFLHMNAKSQFHFVDEISSSYANLEKLFPFYFGIIHGTCREAIIRKSLLESARVCWTEVTNIHLPYICIENILSYINNRYLDALIVSAKPNKKIVTDR